MLFGHYSILRVKNISGKKTLKGRPGRTRNIKYYLDYFHLKKGYMLNYNFNKKKEIGIKEIKIGDRLIVEAVV